jgi:phosphatidylglycerol:prolipoprotein diacylglycerol transferase
MLASLAVYVHDFDPFAIKFTDTFGIRWYGLSYLAGFVLGYFLIMRIVKVGVTPMKRSDVMDFVVAVAFGVVIGGRLGYVLFYSPSLFITFDATAPWWGVLAMNKGGMASHGGLIGVIIACWIFSHRRKLPWTHLLDLTMFAGSVGLGLGRIANFINGELLGRPAPPGLPWAMKFPQEIELWVKRGEFEKLEQLRPVLNEMQGVAGIPQGPVDQPAKYVDNLIRLIQEGAEPVRQKAIAMVEPLLTLRHPSQLYQAIAEGVVLFGVLGLVWLRPRKPGFIFAVCMAVYGVLRIVTEHFREPDEHIRGMEFQMLGVTRGQLLSIAMVALGLVLMWFTSRRNVQKLGGLLPVNSDTSKHI